MLCHVDDGAESREAASKLQALEAELQVLKKELQDMERFSQGRYDFGPGDTFFAYFGR